MNEEKEVVKEVKGIKIGSNYILKNDTLNLVLETWGYKNPSIKDLKAIKEQNIKFEPKWGLLEKHYFANIQQVFNYILEDKFIKGISEPEMDELKKIVNIFDTVRGMFTEFKNAVKLDEDTLKVIE